MLSPRFLLCLAVFRLFGCVVHGAGSEWPQWRGPERSGVLRDAPALLDHWDGDGPRKLWESEEIPSDDDGGHGSVVVAGGRVYLSVVWHRDVPSETRTITELILRVRLNYQNPAALGRELVDKIESARETLSPSLRGAKLDAYIESFVAENLDRKKRELFAGYVGGRFKKGKLAIPLEDYDKLRSKLEQPFASQEDFEAWVNAQGFAEHVKQAVLEAVPASKRVAEDTVVCLDATTGKTLWMTKAPGEPKGRNCSSTPCVLGGRVFAIGSTHLYSMDAETGELKWSQPLAAKAPGSSPLVVDGTVVILAGKLCAFDAVSGNKLWEQSAVTGTNASPVLWEGGSEKVVVCNGRNALFGVDIAKGQVLWTTPGGGDSTPAISGNLAAVLSSVESIGFAGYRISSHDVQSLWTHPTDARRSQSSPIIDGGYAYLFEDGEHRCVHLETGKIAWTQKVNSSITSPVLADGKIFVITGNGNQLVMIKATPEDRVELGKAAIRALWVPSPTPAGNRIFIRHRQGVRCYNLTQSS